MTWVKICGITQSDDAHFAVEAGADMLGFIFSPSSKRYIRPDHACDITQSIHETFGPRAPLCVGVFVATEQTIVQISSECLVSGVDAAQIVGLNDPRPLTRLWAPAYACIRPQTREEAAEQAERLELSDISARLPTLQIDAFHPNLNGGTGETASLEVATYLSQRTRRLMLSGGLNPDNVAEYIRAVRPWAVDVASGVERGPGVKDHEKVQSFIRNAKSALD
jgi:phosphoribosylanthranilate isomerase